MASVSNGLSTPEALQKAFGKSVAQVDKDLRAYVRQSSVQAAVFDVTLPKSNLEAQVAVPSEFEVQIALANLLTSRKETWLEAQQRLTVLEQQHSNEPEVEESLGYLLWQQNEISGARVHFARAVKSGSTNTKMILDYVGLARGQGVSAEELAPLVQTVVDREPDNIDARILLGGLEAEQHRYSAALGVIVQVKKVTPEQAFAFFSLDAYVRAALHDLQDAKISAEKALPYAKTPDQRFQIDNILRYIDESNHPRAEVSASNRTAQERPTIKKLITGEDSAVPIERDPSLLRAVGITKEFECGKGVFRLHLQVGNRELVLGIDKPGDIIVRGVENLQWSCGALKPQKVTVLYHSAAGSKLDGTVTELIF